MVTREVQAKIDKRIALSMKHNDEWESIRYPELTAEENTDIRVARRLGYAVFHCSYPSSEEQSRLTLAGARKYIKEHL